MHDGVITAKLDPPNWIGGQIRREKLLNQLQAVTSNRLTLIHAPAGYGKTSLLAQWLNDFDQQDAETAWLTLEREDGDPKRFAAYLLYAIQRGGRRSNRATKSGALPKSAALSAIVNSLETKPGKFILVLDDFHHAETGPVSELLASLIRLAPRHCHFVIASRDYPSIGQSVLSAAGQVLEVTAQDLRFSPEETHSMLARENKPCAALDVSRILDRTEGWPIAVQLTSLSLKRGADPAKFIERFSGSSSDLARYLSEHVLMTLPEDMREIVMRISLPESLTGEIVDVLCDRHDGWLLLERLENQGVFLSPAGDECTEYRFHQLFVEYLRDRFMRANTPLYLALQERLARWFHSRGDVGEAVNHAVKAGEHALLMEILEDSGGWRLIPQGLQGVLETGLSALPATVIRSRPRLALAQVYLQMKLGELGIARAEYELLETQVGQQEVSADLRTDIRVVGDTLLDYENRPASFEDLLERETLLRKLPASDHLVLANISETLAAKYFEGGWLERALQPTLAAREHYQAINSVYSDLFTQFLEARIKRAQGYSKESSAILERAWETIVSEYGPRSDLAANCAAFKAELLFEAEQLVEAREVLSWSLPHMEQSDGWVDVYAAAYFTEARVLASDGDLDAAWDVLARARRTAARRRLEQLERLTDLVEFDLRLGSGASLGDLAARADALGLAAFADQMAQTSPAYRPVAILAALCRAKLSLLSGDADAALADIERLSAWATQRGAGRLLVDVNLLAAAQHRLAGKAEEASNCFDEAVGIAMFQDLIRPFIELRQFIAPLISDVMAPDREVDRLRAQFLRTLSRALASVRTNPTVNSIFTEAEAEVLYFLSKGHSNKEIARLIDMSPDTVKYRLKTLFKKLGASKRSDAVRIAAERDLIPCSPVSVMQPAK